MKNNILKSIISLFLGITLLIGSSICAYAGTSIPETVEIMSPNKAYGFQIDDGSKTCYSDYIYKGISRPTFYYTNKGSKPVYVKVIDATTGNRLYSYSIDAGAVVDKHVTSLLSTDKYYFKFTSDSKINLTLYIFND